MSDSPGSITRRNWNPRTVLDTVATLAIIVAAGTLIWAALGRRASEANIGRPAIPVPSEPLSFVGAPLLGSAEASIIIIVFSDFQCPFCGRFSQDVLPALTAKYINGGGVALAFRHLPLLQIHPRAKPAAEAAVCAAQQGRFWSMHDMLFSDPKKLEDSHLQEYAKSAGLGQSEFESCLRGEIVGQVTQDTELAKKLKVSSTPTFLFGRRIGSGLARIEKTLAGTGPIEAFSDVIDSLLKRR